MVKESLKQKQNKTFTENSQYLIGKYDSENSAVFAQRKFKVFACIIGESTIRPIDCKNTKQF